LSCTQLIGSISIIWELFELLGQVKLLLASSFNHISKAIKTVLGSGIPKFLQEILLDDFGLGSSDGLPFSSQFLEIDLLLVSGLWIGFDLYLFGFVCFISLSLLCIELSSSLTTELGFEKFSFFLLSSNLVLLSFVS